MCLCTQWLVTPPKGEGKSRYFSTEAQAKAYAAKFTGATIKPPKSTKKGK